MLGLEDSTHPTPTLRNPCDHRTSTLLMHLGSDPDRVEPDLEVRFHRFCTALICLSIGPDGVGDVFAFRMEEHRLFRGLGRVGEHGVEMVLRHRQDVVGRSNQIDGQLLAGMFRKRPAASLNMPAKS